MKKYLGIDVGGGSIKYGLYDETGQALDEGGSAPTIRDNAQAMIDNLSGVINQYEGLTGVGISFPGRINSDTGVVHNGGALTAFVDIPLAQILSERHGVPVALENDANAATLAEYWIGAGKGIDNLVCMTIGTGIGGGLIIGGRLHRGHSFFAGEFHHPYTSFETNGVYGMFGATEPLIERAKKLEGLGIQNGRDFFAHFDNPEVQRLYQEWINALAVIIYNMWAILDPAKVLLGGGISAQDRIYADITARIKAIANIDYIFVVEPCKFRNEAGRIGAVYAVMQKFEL